MCHPHLHRRGVRKNKVYSILHVRINVAVLLNKIYHYHMNAFRANFPLLIVLANRVHSIVMDASF